MSTAILVGTASVARADTLRVVTDIAPVQSIVAMVMNGAGEPDLLVPPGTSPHYFNLKPSDARAISDAQVFVTIGPSLAPWLERMVEMTDPDAEVIELLEVPGTTVFEFRENVSLAEDEHDHGEEGHDDHGHDEDHSADEHGHDDHGDETAAKDDHDHDEHAHDDHDDDHAHDDHGDDHTHDDHGDEHAHDDHADEHADKDHGDDHAHHDHGSGADPHAWLAPANAAIWVDAIANKLGELDPDQEDLYRSNAEAAKEKLTALSADVEGRLADLDKSGYFVMHDAYQYFEDAFGLNPTAAIADSEATTPGAARLRTLRDAAAEGTASCVFTEPQLSRRMVDTVVEGTGVPVVEIDPLGAAIPTGIDLYPQLIDAMVVSFEECFS